MLFCEAVISCFNSWIFRSTRWVNVFPSHCGLVCVRCKWGEIMQKNHCVVAFLSSFMVWKRRNMVALWGGSHKSSRSSGIDLYFHYSVLFVWGGLFCWENKNSKFFIQRVGQKPAEKCVPLQIMFTQWEHPVREAIQSAMLRLSFISYWAKRSVYSLMCSGWICWLNI